MSDVWTPDLVAALRQMWPREDLSVRDMGEILGISHNAVVGKAHRLGLPPRKSPIPEGSHAAAVKAKAEAFAASRPVAALLAVGYSPTCLWFLVKDPAREIRRGRPWAELVCGKPAAPGKSYCQGCLDAHHLYYRFEPAQRRLGRVAAL